METTPFFLNKGDAIVAVSFAVANCYSVYSQPIWPQHSLQSSACVIYQQHSWKETEVGLYHIHNSCLWCRLARACQWPSSWSLLTAGIWWQHLPKDDSFRVNIFPAYLWKYAWFFTTRQTLCIKAAIISDDALCKSFNSHHYYFCPKVPVFPRTNLQ